jgi:ribosomal protein S18 acetylase RimI-like enzyme
MNKMPITLSKALKTNAAEIYALQKKAFYQQAMFYNNFALQPLVETFKDYTREFSLFYTVKAVYKSVIVGAVRGRKTNDTCHISRLIVHPDFQNNGIGTRLMFEIEKYHKGQVKRFELFTGFKSDKSIYLYTKFGYRKIRTDNNHAVPIVYMEKTILETSGKRN